MDMQVFCCICIKSTRIYININDYDSKNIKWIHKLTSCVPEIEWNKNWIICITCSTNLDYVYDFKIRCIDSEVKRKHSSSVNHEVLLRKEMNHEIQKEEEKKVQNVDRKAICNGRSKTFTSKYSLKRHAEKLHDIREEIDENEICRDGGSNSISNNKAGDKIKPIPLESKSNEASEVRLIFHNQQQEHPDVEELKELETIIGCNGVDKQSEVSAKGDVVSDVKNVKLIKADRANVGESSVLTIKQTSAMVDCFEQTNRDSACPLKEREINMIDQNVLQKLSEVRIKKKRGRPLKKNTYVCIFCSFTYETKRNFLKHMSEEHKSDSKTSKSFSCDKCESTFSTASNLYQHKKYHMGDRTHICTYCGKGFITKGDLNVHEKQHLNRREYKCEMCSKCFNTHKDVRSHKLVVHGNPNDWNYVCKYCEKRFPIKSNLDIHVRRHTGDKRFACHLCEKRFVDKVVLQKHIKSHSNVRAHKCEICEREYKDKKILEIHLKRVHDIGDAKVPVRVKKYFCDLCPKAYFAKNKLMRHICSHTGAKPFFCDICQKKFSDKSYVKQHLKTVHSVAQSG